MKQNGIEQWPLWCKSREFSVPPSLTDFQRQLIVQGSCNRNVNTNAPGGQSVIHSGYLLPQLSVALQVFYMQNGLSRHFLLAGRQACL